ncbi:MAG: U32 family peptidase [Candidatus Wallbacteria bacterium]|nr:U32 family peptidase [Candidatus Wallbacteria bacterium]
MPRLSEKIRELLLPAGDPNSFFAALHSGADAIYLGYRSFSARRRARNFSVAELRDLITTARQKQIKVYLTLNTILFPRQLRKLVLLLYFLRSCPPDAFIIQDWGVFRLIRRLFPEYTLHASTQMNNFRRECFEFLAAQGFSRAIAARETTGYELESIKKAVPIELEGFVHGALCISFSGLCQLSAHLQGRSGNRGECAQPCRFPFRLIRDGVKDQTQSSVLSPKDLCLADLIGEYPLDFMKIEGRQKSDNYVFQVGHYYRALIDGCHPSNHSPVDFVFNRDFSPGHFKGRNPLDLLNPEIVSSSGRDIGKALAWGDKYLDASLTFELYPGMGILAGTRGGIVTRIEKLDHNRFRLWGGYKGEPGPPGQTVFLNSIPSNAGYRDSKTVRFSEKIQLMILLAPQQAIVFQYNGLSFKSSIIPAPAREGEKGAAQLSGLPGLIREKLFEFREERIEAITDVHIAAPLFLTYSMINRLKQEIRMSFRSSRRIDISGLMPEYSREKKARRKSIWARVHTFEDLMLYKRYAKSFNGLYFHYKLAESVSPDPCHAPFFLPSGYEDRSMILDQLKKKGFTTLLAGDTSALKTGKAEGWKIMIDHYIPLANQESMLWASDIGATRAAVSTEVPNNQLNEIFGLTGVPELEQIVFHRPVLLFSSCCFFNQYSCRDSLSLEWNNRRVFDFVKHDCLNLLLHDRIVTTSPHEEADVYRVDLSFTGAMGKSAEAALIKCLNHLRTITGEFPSSAGFDQRKI